VAVGLGLSGAATYAFFAVASRALDPVDYAAIGVLWSLLFAVGNGVMQPLEQEVARAVSDRRARGIGPGPVVRRAVRIGVGFTAVLCVAATATELGARALDEDPGWLLSNLFGGNEVLVVVFLVGLAGFCAAHLTRGALSSHGRFAAYATFFAVDGIGRVLLAGVLAVAGVATVGAWGAILAAAPFLGVAVALRGQRDLTEAGPEASWGELTRALGWLLAGTGSLALVVQGGTVAVQVLADADQADAAGVFLNGLQIARIPLFLFQAVLASLLPRLSRQAAGGDLAAFRHGLGRLVGAILGVGALAVVAATVVGPVVVDLLFDATTALEARDLGLLSGAFVVIMAAICLDQGLIALGAHRLMACGWMLSLATFVVVTALGDDLFLRVEVGLVAGAAVAFGWMLACLTWQLRRSSAHVEPVSFAEAVAESPLTE
jgi:O-antigen/teichoic acid export membrane protein